MPPFFQNLIKKPQLRQPTNIPTFSSLGQTAQVAPNIQSVKNIFSGLPLAPQNFNVPRGFANQQQKINQNIQNGQQNQITNQPLTNTENFTTPSGVQVDTQGNIIQGNAINTGNPQLDTLLNNIPAIQKALGIGVETEQQKAFREQQQTSLQRLVTLQEQLTQAGAPNSTIADLDKVIQEQQKALRTTSPEELLRSTPQFQQEGITMEQLQRESASRRAPIAQALSDLLTSRSILGQQQKRQQQAIQGQIQSAQDIFGLQQAFQSLQPQRGIAPEIQQGILQGVMGQVFKDPLDKQFKQAQIDNLNSQRLERDRKSEGVGDFRLLGNEDFIFAERPNLTAQEKQKIQVLDEGLKFVDQVETLYKQAVGEEIGGTTGAILSRGKGLSRFLGGLIGTQQGFSLYQEFLDSNRAKIAKGLKGEVGNLTENEQKNALKSFPGKFTSPDKAKNKFEEIRKQMIDNLSTLGQFTEEPQFGNGDLESDFNKFITQ